MRQKKVLFLCTVLLFVTFNITVAAESILTLRMSQIYVKFPEVTVFFEVTDELGLLKGDLTPDRLLVDVADNPASVSAYDAITEGVTYLFLIDASKSIKTEELKQMKETVNFWIDQLGEKDKAAVITLGESVIPFGFDGDKTTLHEKVENLQFLEGEGQLFTALTTVLPKLRGTVAGLSTRRVIIALGSSIAGFGDNIQRQTLLKLLESHLIPVYLIDFAGSPDLSNGETNMKRQAIINSVKEVTEKVAGQVYQTSNIPMEEIYRKITEKIHTVYAVKFTVINLQPVKSLKDSTFQLHIKIIQKQQTSYLNPITLPELRENRFKRDNTILKFPKWFLHTSTYFIFGLIIIWGLFFWIKWPSKDDVDDEDIENSLQIKKIVPANAQNIGTREEQQDALAFSEMDNAELVNNVGIIAVLADGMGGLQMGRDVSNMAVRLMLNEYIHKPISESIPLALRRVLYMVNHSIVEMVKKEEFRGNIGSTLAAVVIDNHSLYWISVGNSRIYLHRKGRLTCLTEDHIYARELAIKVASGQLTHDEVADHPEWGVLTSYLGFTEIDEIDQNIKPFQLLAGDKILLCSDGLTGTLSEDEITRYLSGNPQEAAEALVKQVLACQKEFQDNVTVAILACE